MRAQCRFAHWENDFYQSILAADKQTDEELRDEVKMSEDFDFGFVIFSRKIV